LTVSIIVAFARNVPEIPVTVTIEVVDAGAEFVHVPPPPLVPVQPKRSPRPA
jgi:hypothetical protein